MKINEIAFLNFRRFTGQHRISLHPELTVFAANNGAGKTSILDAIALAFGSFLTRLPKISGNSPRDSDVSIPPESGAPVLILAADVQLSAEHSARWTRHRVAPYESFTKRDAKKFTEDRVPTGIKEINAYADHLSQNQDSEEVFPILAYYGTGRAILDVPQRRRGFGKEFPRIQAYADCLNPKTNFRKLFEYFYFLEDLERREKEERQDWSHRNGQLEALRNAIVACIPEFENPRTKLAPLRLILDSKADGREYDIKILSDGFKTCIAMVMDIAMRMVEANPKLGAKALNIPGIILIDEIELHLHPSWQQRIIPDLQRTFPNVQFICTTHSPQVLSTVKQESIRVITEDGTILTGEEVGVNSYGAQSYFILEDLMNVSPNPHIAEVEALKDTLKSQLEGSGLKLDHPDLLKLEQMIGSKDPFIRNLKASIIRKGKVHA